MAAYDLDGGTFESKTLLLTGETNNPYAMAISSDGSKVYVMGISEDKIFQYTLTTDFDVSTGSYASKSLDHSTQLTAANGFGFSPDGMKVYVCGTSADPTTYQYNLTIAWDLSTGSYASKSFDPTEVTDPYAVALSSDGTKAYWGDLSGETIYQYTLSSAFDISSASYASKSMSFAAEHSAWRDMDFASDGTRVYTVDPGSNALYQYNLTIAWDVSTGSYASKSLGVGSQDTNMFGLAVSSDGFKAYGVGLDNKKVYQYKLADPPLLEEATEDADTTDSISVELEIYRTVTDVAGTTDSVTFAKDRYAILADVAGTTDSVTIFVATEFRETATEAFDTTDSVTIELFPLTAVMDLTGDSHLLRMPTNHGIRTYLDRFYARFDYLYQGLAVVVTETSSDVWTVTTFPGQASIPVDDLSAANQVFYGGSTWVVTGSLAMALIAAGYDVTLD